MKAQFYKRVLAYLIDVVILSLIISVIVNIFIPNSNLLVLKNELDKVTEQFLANEITNKVMINRWIDINYDMKYQAIGQDIIGFTLYVCYFIIVQFKNNGQTIGKKIMKIKIEKEDGSLLTIDDMVKRSLIINGLLVKMLSLTAVLALEKRMFFGFSLAIEGTQMLIIVISSFMILYRKDGRGLQDLWGQTKVTITETV